MEKLRLSRRSPLIMDCLGNKEFAAAHGIGGSKASPGAGR